MTATSAQPQEVGHRLSGRLGPLKPKLRGWLHAGTFPFATAAGIVLICLAPHANARWAAAVYTAGSMLLFGISALYHRFYWGPTGEAILIDYGLAQWGRTSVRKYLAAIPTTP